MNFNVINFVFWLLLRICSAPGLVERIRTETAFSAKASLPVQSFGIPVPPLLELSVERLLQSCPLLRSCFHKCLGLDTSPVPIRSICRDISITKCRQDLFGNERPASYQLKVGEMMAIPLRMYHLDSQESNFGADSVLAGIETGSKRIVDDPRHSIPWDDRETMFPLPKFSEPIILALVAGILALWDIESLDPEQPAFPRHQTSPSFSIPENDIRFRVRRRRLSVSQ